MNASSPEQLYGVALGGWLVLEPYITPSLFDVFVNTLAANATENVPVDEYTYCQQLGEAEATLRLTQHWLTWITEDDIAAIAKCGLNMVRIPVGYWLFARLADDPYVAGAESYLDAALGWCKTHGLVAWVDLHGVPGLQNGFDNLGKRGPVGWLNTTANINTTVATLDYIFGKYGNMLAVVGIEVVNEPLGPKLNMTTVEALYEQEYWRARSRHHVDGTLVFHDAFEGIGYWDLVMSNSLYYNVVIDLHHYEVFTGLQLATLLDGHVANIENYAQGLVEHRGNHTAVVGEWLAALTDCAPWLNGVNMGARYNGTFDGNEYVGTCDNITDIKRWLKQQKRNTRAFVEAQLDNYNRTSGWVFWCWKTESTIEWDFKRLVEYDLMPQPLTERKYYREGRLASLGAVLVSRAWLVVAVVAMVM